MTDAGFPGVGHLDAAEGGRHFRRAGTFARNMNVGQRFVIRPECMRVPSTTDRVAPETANEPVTLFSHCGPTDFFPGLRTCHYVMWVEFQPLSGRRQSYRGGQRRKLTAAPADEGCRRRLRQAVSGGRSLGTVSSPPACQPELVSSP